MSWKKNLLVALSMVLVIALGAGYVLIYPILAVGSAYKAHMLCMGVFVEARATEHVLDNELRSWNYRYLISSIDREERSVTASFIGLAMRTSEFYGDRGCVLTHGLRLDDEGAGELQTTPDPDWPQPPVPSVDLQQVVQAWFAPDLRTHAVVVVRGGELVYEQYAVGIDANTRLLGWSMTKSLVHAQVGRLLQLGLLESTDTRTSIWSSHPADPRGAITLEHLLRMSSGLKWDERYFPPSDVTSMLFTTRNASDFAASVSLQHQPGDYWYYSSGTSNILSSIVAQRAGGLSTHELLFRPAGMHSALIGTDARGNEVGSSFGMASARDWARFGVLYLNDGVRHGVRLLPEGWVEHARTPVPSQPLYGAHWWLNPMQESGEAHYRGMPVGMFSAEGFDGQFVFVIPSTGSVIVRLGAKDPGHERLSQLLHDTHNALTAQ